jgi:predicted methyltransferase
MRRLRPLVLLPLLAACATTGASPGTSSSTPPAAGAPGAGGPAAAAPTGEALPAPTPARRPSPEEARAAARAAVEAPDRSEADRALDAGRKPAELLAFAGVAPGMHVAELLAGAGSTTELLARAVGVEGRVYGHNTPFVLQRFAEKRWAERLAKPVMARVVRVDAEFEEPLPPEARGLDVVVSHAIYHDTVWMKADRARMNAAVFRALRPGGVYLVVDSSARPGSGLADVETLHRIDEQRVRQEVQQAGFRLDAEGDFLRNPQDPRDWNAAPNAAADKRGTSDRFVLRFVKP